MRCSHATVSLALSGNPRISADVRTKVMQIAEKMGCRPDRVRAVFV
jgi:DNA-binding LacI/PurR family transcriptional regulator